jgi:hypothetical protein
MLWVFRLAAGLFWLSPVALASANEHFKDARENKMQCRDFCEPRQPTVTGERIIVTPGDRGIQPSDFPTDFGPARFGGDGPGNTPGPATSSNQAATQQAIVAKIAKAETAKVDFERIEAQLADAIKVATANNARRLARIEANNLERQALEARVANSQQNFDKNFQDAMESLGNALEREAEDFGAPAGPPILEAASKLETAADAMDTLQGISDAEDALVDPHLLPDQIEKLNSENARLVERNSKNETILEAYRAALAASEAARLAVEAELARLKSGGP